ncbi:mechanosensitive ion channel family protein [Parapedobacter koreensis]|uniref:Small conductance mechanosensitive channel n=1 Tax=Parapedobacter koreensis TaxID=332977 RepID=A0A1H7MFY7_9SPHI|nr:mechanosensitive ion channel domain-containing protein [Parapedobacter koreensis]SEL10064.1 small conductance mechanosensitive channel [Parapedobacter koreensis]
MQANNIRDIGDHWNRLIASAVEWAPRIITAVITAALVYVIGLWLIRVIKRVLHGTFERRQMEPSLRLFVSNLVSWVLNILLFIVVVTQLGVQTSAFVAIIGAAGLAIGLALQGSLSNFAGGVLILLLKPFRVGDYISSSNGESGTVKEIDIFNTKLNTPQNQILVVPNGTLSNSSITNFSQLPVRRTWFDIGVSYDADLKKAKEILLEVISNNEFAHKIQPHRWSLPNWEIVRSTYRYV